VGRRLGQHFLSDPAILDRIADALEPSAEDLVIEVGPGRGSLTRRAAPRVGRLIAIEKDDRLAARLVEEQGAGSGERGFGSNVVVIRGDALAMDWHVLITESQPPAPRSLLPVFKVTGNVPYYITSPLIDKALTPPRPDMIVFLVQREVADRVVAPPGDKTYGALSVGVQSVARAERLFTVRPGSFTPPPKVDSAVIRLSPMRDPLVDDAKVAGFRRFVTAVFAQRRKQLTRSLRSVTGWDRDDVEAVLGEVGVGVTARPETLPPETFVRLFKRVSR
jgi:16S rRNA (adenine1518-N6/adenine1519-N6)-dimethyltransferase